MYTINEEDFSRAIEEVRPLVHDLFDADTRTTFVDSVSALQNFIDAATDVQIYVFCTISWPSGKSIFSAALQNGVTEISDFPQPMQLLVGAVSTLWVRVYKRNPEIVKAGLEYAENQFWQKGDRASDWWGTWIQSALLHS